MKLHSEELNNLYSSLNIIRQITPKRMSWAGHVARHAWEKTLKCTRFMGKFEGKKTLGRQRLRWEDGI
jgi:hypothetical protein